MGAGVYDSRGVPPSATPSYPTAADGTGDGNVSGRARLGSYRNSNLSNNQNGSAGGSAGSGVAGPGVAGPGMMGPGSRPSSGAPSSGAPNEPYGGGRKQSVGSANVRSNWDQVCPYTGFALALRWPFADLTLASLAFH